MEYSKLVSELIDEFEKIENEVFYSSDYHQFTIDFIQNSIEELEYFKQGESENYFEDIIGSLMYKVNCAIEICDHSNKDYYILIAIYDLLEKYN